MVEVTIHPEAEADYEHALAWYLDRNPWAAARFETAFDDAVEAIRAHPSMFPFCDNVHQFILLDRYPYSLIYRLDGEAARLIAVAHLKRRPGFWSART
ncbi:MAG: type II toxin-antitoxin system RelE/ParE family toxin [Isosphaeraceae bacterium]